MTTTPAQTTYVADKILAYTFGGASYTQPTPYMAAVRCSAGQSPRSTAVTSGQTTVPASPNGHMYRCTTAGTTGAGEPTWGVTSGGTTTDGTATWTEMTPDFQAFNSNVTGVEANYTGYTRVAVGSAMGTPAANSITKTSAISLPACTGGTNVLGAWFTADASTSGNGLWFGCLTATLSVSSGITPSFAASALTASSN